MSLLGTASRGLAQERVEGRVWNRLGRPVPDAYILVLDPRTSSLKAHTYTEQTGGFSLLLESVSDFRLRLVVPGYQPLDTLIAKMPDGRFPRLRLVLLPGAMQLDEVVVKAPRTFRMHRDTLEFNLSSYSGGTERVVEEALRRIPGVEVTEEGEIRVRGKPVSKVLVEGDNLTDQRYRVLTRNLDAEVVDRVQFLFDHQDNPLLRGIRNSGEIALNLQLKPEFKGRISGNLSPAAGPSGRYEARVNLLYIRKKTKLYVLGNGNEVGTDPVGEAYDLMRPGAYDSDPLPGEREQTKGVFTPMLPPSALNNREYVQNRSAVGGLQSVWHLTRGTKITSRLLATRDQEKIQRQTREVFRFGNLAFTNEEHTVQVLRESLVSSELEVHQEIGRAHRLEVTQKIDLGRFLAPDQFVFNDGQLDQRRSLGLDRWDFALSHTWKLGTSTVMQTRGRVHSERRGSKLFAIHDDNMVFEPYKDFGQVHQEAVTRQGFGGFQFLLDHKTGPWNFRAALGWEILSSDLRATPAGRGLPDHRLRAEDLRRSFLASVRAEWTGPAVRLQAGLQTVHTRNHFAQESICRVALTGMVPRLRFIWDQASKSKIHLSYGMDIRDSHFSEQWRGPLWTGYRSLRSGLGRFARNRSHNLSLGYTRGEWGDRTMLHATLLLKREPRYLGYQNVQSGFLSLARLQMLSNRNSGTFNLTLDRYLPGLAANLKLRVNAGSRAYETEVNGLRARFRGQNIELGPEFRSAWGQGLGFHTGLSFARSWAHMQNTNRRDSYRGFLDLEFRKDTQWASLLKAEYLSFPDSGSGGLLLLSLRLIHRPRSSRTHFRLLAENILNSGRFGFKNLQDTGFYEASYRLQPRRFLLQMTVRL